MSDKFRKIYKSLHEENSKLITEMKESAEKLDSLFDFVKSREMSLAVTNLEQAMMWATKAIVLEDEKNGSQPVRFPK
jgi:hypothetical protein